MRTVKIEPAHWPYVVGCLADTHVPRRARHLPGELYELLQGVDLILHAGDLVSEDVLADLEPLAPVEAVAGNMDPTPLPVRLGRAALLAVGLWRVGLVHGDRGEEPTTPLRALGAFRGFDPDVVVFGHSHQPTVEMREGVLLLNPGSPTDHRLSPWPSYGLLTLPGPGRKDLPRAEIRPLAGAG